MKKLEINWSLVIALSIVLYILLIVGVLPC